MTNSSASENKKVNRCNIKNYNRRRRKQRSSSISREPMTRSTKRKHLNNMGIQGRIIMEYIRELISERWIKVRVGGFISQSKQNDFGIPQGGALSITLFLMAINGILGEYGNGVNGSLFPDDMAIYN